VQHDADSLVQAHDGTNWVTLATLSGATATMFGSSNIQVLLSGNSVAPVVLSGSTSIDTLTGSAADETLDGAKGADAMAGGSGNDVYYVDDAQDLVSELIGGGTDTVYASTNYTLQAGSEVEILAVNSAVAAGLILTGNEFDNLLQGGVGDDSLRGLQGDDTLEGNGGDDSLDGGTGVDVLNGGAGDDTYFVDNLADQIIETTGNGIDTLFVSASYTLAEGVEVEFLRANPNAQQVAMKGNSLDNTIYGSLGNDTLDGGGGNDRLAGGAGNDTILGGAGDDRIDGQGGIDALIGGAGNDIYNVGDAADSVVEFVGDGFDTVFASTNYALQTGSEVEVLRAVGNGSISLTGNEFGNTIQGNAGADVLSGLGGDDALFGGGGIDVLIGGAGNDRLDGGTGADAMTGGTGNDTYIVDNATDAVIEADGGGLDTVFATVSYALQAGSSVENLRAYAGSGDLALTGNELANTVIGGAGADTLNGGGGDDTLTGGLGADTFVFDFGGGNDTVTDFTGGQDVCSFDASAFADFDALIASAVQSGADTVITVDADQSVTLNGVTLSALQASDFTFA
jgi:Ca2+-binding RTX toxin-like protein